MARSETLCPSPRFLLKFGLGWSHTRLMYAATISLRLLYNLPDVSWRDLIIHFLCLLYPFYPLFCSSLWSLLGGHVIQMSHLGLSILQPCILTSVSHCVNHCLLQDSLMRPALQTKVYEWILVIKFLPSIYEAWVWTPETHTHRSILLPFFW